MTLKEAHEIQRKELMALRRENERLKKGTYTDADYSVLNDKRNSLLAQEYFYGKFKYGDSFKSKFRCFVSYYYLKKQGKKRIVPCQYLRRDITIDENLNMFLYFFL